MKEPMPGKTPARPVKIQRCNKEVYLVSLKKPGLNINTGIL